MRTQRVPRRGRPADRSQSGAVRVQRSFALAPAIGQIPPDRGGESSFALSCMASVPADKPGIGAAWGRTRHLRHTSCRSRARRGRSIMRHGAAASGCVKPGMPFISTSQQNCGVDDHAPLLRTVTQIVGTNEFPDRRAGYQKSAACYQATISLTLPRSLRSAGCLLASPEPAQKG